MSLTSLIFQVTVVALVVLSLAQVGQTGKDTGKQTGKQSGKQTGKQTGKQSAEPKDCDRKHPEVCLEVRDSEFPTMTVACKGDGKEEMNPKCVYVGVKSDAYGGSASKADDLTDAPDDKKKCKELKSGKCYDRCKKRAGGQVYDFELTAGAPTVKVCLLEYHAYSCPLSSGNICSCSFFADEDSVHDKDVKQGAKCVAS